jgi:cytochrome c oxidase subunit 2
MKRGRSALRALALGVPLLLGVVTACGDDAPSSDRPDPPSGSDVGDGSAVERGQALARTRGCAACHGADGQGGIGPAWTALVGSTVTLEDGSTVTADEAYVVESIVDPTAKVVDGFSVAMPTTTLSDAEVTDLVAYITSLT